MKKGFLVVLLIILAGLIGYQVYQNKVEIREGGQAKALIDIKEVNEIKKPKSIEPVFESASSTIQVVRDQKGQVSTLVANFTVKTTAGSKKMNLPISAQIDLVSITATPTTVMSARTNSQSIPSEIAVGKTMPLYFTASFPASSTIPMGGGTYKAVMKYVYIMGSTKEVKFGTDALVVR